MTPRQKAIYSAVNIALLILLLQIYYKKRKESAELYRANGRAELAEPEEKEAAILQEFLPKQLSEDEIRAMVEAAVADLDATMQQMGQVIGAVKTKAGNAADGALIAKITKETLAKQ